MKKRMVYQAKSVVIGKEGEVCDKCLHVRVGEPYIFEMANASKGDLKPHRTCWRCCRDAESTFLIHQKWPLAFKLIPLTQGWILEWVESVKALVGENDKA